MTEEQDKGKLKAEERRLLSIAGRLGIEIVVGVVVGCTMGYFIDKFFSTKPLFFVIFALFGVAAGVLNVYRFVKDFDARVGYLGQKPQDKKDQDSDEGGNNGS